MYIAKDLFLIVYPKMYGKSAPFENRLKRQELFVILVSSGLHLETGDGKDCVAHISGKRT